MRHVRNKRYDMKIAKRKIFRIHSFHEELTKHFLDVLHLFHLFPPFLQRCRLLLQSVMSLSNLSPAFSLCPCLNEVQKRVTDDGHSIQSCESRAQLGNLERWAILGKEAGGWAALAPLIFLKKHKYFQVTVCLVAFKVYVQQYI